MNYEDKVVGSILGGAVGDALGYPIEFMNSNAVARVGLLDHYMYEKGHISDDTQMTIFSMEAAPYPQKVRAFKHALAAQYYDWYRTQVEEFPDVDAQGIMRAGWLYDVREPGNTCMGALGYVNKRGQLPRPIAKSKGCGSAMRAAPFGLLRDGKPGTAYYRAHIGGNLTHGSYEAGEAAGFLACLIQFIVNGSPLPEAITLARRYLPVDGEVNLMIDRAIMASFEGGAQDVLEKWLGEGWTAPEAVAIALYAVLCHPEDFRASVALAATHGGDSDSTAAIAGNISGVLLGVQAIPKDLCSQLAHSQDIVALAERFAVRVNA